MRKFRLLISLSLLILLSNSCDKRRAIKWAGIYECDVEYHYSDVMGTHIDSTYTQEIEVERDFRNLIIFDREIHVDELRNEQEYYDGSYSHNMTIQFVDDVLYIHRYSGGQGGNSSVKYVGTKK